MQTMKRWLALVMALVLLTTCVPVTARAAEVDSDTTVSEPVESEVSGDAGTVVAEGVMENNGTPITWKRYSSGLLTLDGTGEIPSKGDWGWDGVTDIVIGEGITGIGNSAFYGYSLNSVTIPETVTRIGDSAFNSTGLAEVNIPEGVTSIGSEAFWCCHLTSITIPGSVISIGNDAFNSCTYMTELTISEGVTTIGENAFRAIGVKSVTIPESVTSIGNNAFESVNATEITIPGKLFENFRNIFPYTYELKKVTVLDGATSIGDDAFSNCYYLTSVTLPEGVTSIGNNAFNGCSDLTSVALPKSVTSIGEYAFNGCSSLTSVTLPECLSSIGERAFYGCSRLTSITIPESVTSIGAEAFRDCYGLRTITFEGDAPEIGSSALNYWYNPALKAYYPANNATWTEEKLQAYTANACYGEDYVEWTAMGNFTGIEVVEVPNLIVGEELNPEDFKVVAKYDNGLEIELDDVEIKEVETDKPNRKVVVIIWREQEIEVEIPVHAGRKTVTLDPATYPESKHDYDNNMDETQVLTYPGAESLTLTFSQDTYTEGSCDSIYVYDGNDQQIDCYYGGNAAGVTVTVPGDTVKIRLTSDSSVIYYGYSFSSITAYAVEHTGSAGTAIGATCTEAGRTAGVICDICGEHAYYEIVPALGHDFVDGSCSRCGEDFYVDGTSGSITWEINKDGVLTISGEGALYTQWTNTGNVMPWHNYMDMVTSAVINEGITEIGSNVFQNYVNLKTVSIPNTVTSIGYRAFYGCTGLESIVIPENVTSLGSYVFYECSALKSVEIKGAITTVPSYAFYNCSALSEVTLPESVTSIGSYAFYGCSSLGKIDIPAAVASFGPRVFEGCSSLTEFVIPEGVTNIGGYMFAECTALKSVTIPESVFAISKFAFYRCESLESVTIPGTLNGMGYSVFLNCFNLKSVTIANVGQYFTSLPDYTFHNCKKLETVVLPDTIKSIGYRAFHNCVALKDLEMPSTVTGIAYAAFHNCESLTTLDLPTTLNSIGADAFGCSGLEEITFQGKAPDTMGENMFWEVEATANYPANDTSWTAEKMQQYGGKITWTTAGCAHEWTEATCTAAKTCSKCGATEGAALGHDMKETSAAVAATCEKAGKTVVRTCANGCGKTEGGAELPALGHDMKETSGAVAATCEKAGKTAVKTCANGCGKTEGGAEIPALKHNYEAKVTKEATCTEKGIKTYTCKNDGTHTYTEEIAAKGHTEVAVAGKAATCTATGLTEGKKCSVCGTVTVAQTTIAATGHTSVVDAAVAATCTANGKTEGAHCSVCNAVLTAQQEIPATGHSYSTKDKETFTCGTCGDTFTVNVEGIVENVLKDAAEGTASEEAVAEAVEQIQQIDTEQLKEAMSADTDDTGIVDQLTQLEELVDTNVNVSVEEEVKDNFDASEITIVGAKLNDVESEEEDIVLNVGKTEGESQLQIPKEYEQTTAVSFSMKLENIENVKDLKVPVKITLPVPADMDTDGLVVIHYNDDGSIKEILIPTIIEVDGDLYACIVVTGFSNFSVVEKHVHSFENWTVTKAATCIATGIKTATCSCGEAKTAEISLARHTYVGESCSVCGAVKPDVPEVEGVTRLAGDSRYETSFAIANEMKEVLGVEKFENIILANSDNFADALAGSYLAAVKEAPIIIGKQKYASLVCEYLNANLAEGGTVYILGGTDAMPDSILNDLTVKYNPVRLAGSERYETNLEILKEAGISGKDLLVATGRDFADSLSASATGLPILLVNGKPDKTLSDEQKAFLATVEGEIFIIGGESAVPASMVEQIEEASGKTTTRIAGGSRYETSVKIAEKFLKDAETAVVAYASTFPDGLCGGPLAYTVGAPLLLTKDGKAEAPDYTKANAITSGYVLGGDGLISDDFAKTIFQATEIVK